MAAESGVGVNTAGVSGTHPLPASSRSMPRSYASQPGGDKGPRAALPACRARELYNSRLLPCCLLSALVRMKGLPYSFPTHLFPTHFLLAALEYNLQPGANCPDCLLVPGHLHPGLGGQVLLPHGFVPPV